MRRKYNGFRVACKVCINELPYFSMAYPTTTTTTTAAKNTYVHTSKHTHEQEYTHVFFAFLLSSPKLCPAKTFNNSNVRFLNCFLSLSLLLSPPGLSVYPGIGKEKTVTEKASSALYATTRIHPTRPPPRLKFSTYVSIACCTFRTGEHNSSTQS